MSLLNSAAQLFFDKFVQTPTILDEVNNHNHEFVRAGLPGAIGSMDATHISLDKVRHSRRQAHLGYKLSTTSRTYNIVVNHRRKILSTTSGHPARWNDKTIVRFDPLTMGIHRGTSALNDFAFELYDYDGDGQIIKQKYQGVWLLVDNGYHRWS